MTNLADVVSKIKKKFDTYSQLTADQMAALGISQDLYRECESVADMCFVASKILAEGFGIQSTVGLLDSENSLIQPSFEMIPSDLELILNRSLAQGVQATETFFPIFGKEDSQAEMGFPNNNGCVIGVLYAEKPNGSLSESDKKFLQRFSGRLGSAIHERYLLTTTKGRKEFNDLLLQLVNHDSRSALTGLNLIGKAKNHLTKPTPDLRRALDCLDAAQDSATQLGEVLGLFSLGRYDTPANTNLFSDVGTLIADVQQNLRRKHNYSFVVSIDRDIANRSATINRPLFRSIVNNLLGNAIKYSSVTQGPGGVILTSMYLENDMFVYDSINSVVEPIPKETLPLLLNSGARGQSKANQNIGLNQGLGLSGVCELAGKCYPGSSFVLESGNSKSIAKALDVQAKEVKLFNLSQGAPAEIGPYFRVEVRIPNKYVGF